MGRLSVILGGRGLSVAEADAVAAIPWVRKLALADRELKPNHAWRHTFKQIADRVGISERMSD